jgi:hypothetical protein
MNEEGYEVFRPFGKYPFEVQAKVEEDDEESDLTTKYPYLAEFPPKIWIVLPDGASVKLTAKSEHVPEKDQRLVDIDLTSTEFHFWM